MDIRLDNLGVMEDLLNRFMEEILSELFKTGTSEGSLLEIDTLKGWVNFDGFLGRKRKGMLSMLTSSVETTKTTGI